MSRRGGAGARAPLIQAAALMLISLSAATAFARSSVVVPYTIGEVWPAAIRFLRVDRNYRVREKDEPAGYVLFDLPENKRTYRAALEMVKTTDDDGRVATQITCSISWPPRSARSAARRQRTVRRSPAIRRRKRTSRSRSPSPSPTRAISASCPSPRPGDRSRRGLRPQASRTGRVSRQGAKNAKSGSMNNPDQTLAVASWRSISGLRPEA